MVPDAAGAMIGLADPAAAYAANALMS
eukprot:SAG11_NODE_24511_length_372_cov_0.934066_1_plen_26_part_01